MTTSGSRYDDLAALYINCTLKPSPELSHTQGPTGTRTIQRTRSNPPPRRPGRCRSSMIRTRVSFR
jgi:hypothetical protein